MNDSGGDLRLVNRALSPWPVSAKGVSLLREITLACVVMLACCLTFLPCPAIAEGSNSVSPSSSEAMSQSASGNVRIHVMAFDFMDAIVLESDGHFGVVDSGEDSTMPDGSDSRYPVRSGTSPASLGVEDEVISYMRSIGVTDQNLDFYIGTHPHSDHIGSAQQVIEAFRPKRVYTPRYEDSYVTNPAALWDNLYCYDRLISASQGVNAQLIQDFDEQNRRFQLGSARIELENTGTSYQASPVVDANCFSLGVKVTAGGHTAFLSGDINNLTGAEDALAKTLGHIDFLKLGHHGLNGSNTPGYLSAILDGSSIAFQTADPSWMPEETIRTLQRLGVRFACSDDLKAEAKKAFVISFDSGAISTNYDFPPKAYRVGGSARYASFSPLDGWVKVDGGWAWFANAYVPTKSSWIHQGGSWYYVSDDGLMVTRWLRQNSSWYWFDPSGAMATGWRAVDGQWSYFDASGIMQTGWQNIGGAWYFIEPSGYMRTGWLYRGGNWYWLKPSGEMATGWALANGAWYWFDPSGVMRTGWLNLGGTWYYLTGSGAMAIGWLKLNNTWYWLEPSGAMAVGWTNVGGTWYWFDGSGAMATGWVRLKGTWYYLDSSGAMRTGWLKAGNAWYWLDSDGAMAVGWRQIDGIWYYFRESGTWLGGAAA